MPGLQWLRNARQHHGYALIFVIDNRWNTEMIIKGLTTSQQTILNNWPVIMNFGDNIMPQFDSTTPQQIASDWTMFLGEVMKDYKINQIQIAMRDKDGNYSAPIPLPEKVQFEVRTVVAFTVHGLEVHGGEVFLVVSINGEHDFRWSLQFEEYTEKHNEYLHWCRLNPHATKECSAEEMALKMLFTEIIERSEKQRHCPGADYSDGSFDCAYGYTVKCTECTIGRKYHGGN